MTKEQKEFIRYDYGFALLPYSFSEAVTNHCTYDYKKENIDNPLAVDIGSLGKFWKFIDKVSYPELTNDSIDIIQNENQNDSCLVPLFKGVEKVIAFFKNGEKEYKTSISIFNNLSVCAIDFNFDNEIKEIKLFFNYDIVEPLLIKVNTKPYKAPVLDERPLLLNKLNVKHSTGNDLITIRFSNANDKVAETRISLFDSSKQLMGVFKVDEGMLYKSISNLAYDTYFYKVSQFDKFGNEIIGTDFIQFRLIMPNYGKPTVCSN